MVTNPYRERYRKLFDGPLLDPVAYSSAKGKLMIELFYALEDALEKIERLEGKTYELEQTLEGQAAFAEKQRANSLEGFQPSAADFTDAEWEEFERG